MFTISLTPEVADDLRVLLEQAEDSAARLRIREYRSGCA